MPANADATRVWFVFEEVSSDTDLWVFYLVVGIVFLVQLICSMLYLSFVHKCRRKPRKDRFRERFLQSCPLGFFFAEKDRLVLAVVPCVSFLRRPMPTRFPSRAKADAIRYQLTLLGIASCEFIYYFVRFPNLLVRRTRISVFRLDMFQRRCSSRSRTLGVIIRDIFRLLILSAASLFPCLMYARLPRGRQLAVVCF